MREQHDPVRLMVKLGTLSVLLATVAPSSGSLRDVAAASEQSLVARAPASFDDHEWARCRTITAAQSPWNEACRRIWADNRRRFIRLKQEVKASITSRPTTPSQQSSDNTRADSNRPTYSPIQQE